MLKCDGEWRDIPPASEDEAHVPERAAEKEKSGSAGAGLLPNGGRVRTASPPRPRRSAPVKTVAGLKMAERK